jgi:hypothetical protein
MTERFEQVLEDRGHPWIKVSGGLEEKLKRGILEVDKLLA